MSPYVDYVITFEELQALFDSRDILLRDQEITEWNQASYYGRMFATSGGVAAAVAEILKEMKVDDFELNAISCDGIDKCKAALLKASKGVLPNNFIEGMVCMRGCVGGMGNPTWREDISEEIEEHAEEAEITEILSASGAVKAVHLLRHGDRSFGILVRNSVYRANYIKTDFWAPKM